MANLTLSIPDSELARARKVAAARGTTVNNMVRDFLVKEIGGLTLDQQAAIARMTARSEKWAGHAAGPAPSRAETYDGTVSPRF